MLHLKQYLNTSQQKRFLELARQIPLISPLFQPVMPNGKQFNCKMTSCGDFGWISDRNGYRYDRLHPFTHQPFAPMPKEFSDLAIKIANSIGEFDYKPQSCLINYYPISGRLGIHQDNTEKNLVPAIISISLGDDAIFAIGGNKYSDRIHEILLKSGDILVLHGNSRLFFHGIKRIVPFTSNLLKNGGRLNFTIRQVI
jgi:Alkylated DNA repair protein